MATYVLVHGAWRGSWIWARVRDRLQRAGHFVFAPTMTGLADRSHLLSREIDLDTHIADIVGLIDFEELTDVILCGHSYGGCVVTGVADQRADRLRALIYLDAFVPEAGQSLWDLLPVEQRQNQRGAVDREGDGWKVPPIPAEVFGVNERDRDWVDRQATPQPLATFRQAIRLTGDQKVAFPVTYILATGYEHSPFQPFYERAKSMGWATQTIDCGHDAMLDEPDRLSEILLAAAGS